MATITLDISEGAKRHFDRDEGAKLRAATLLEDAFIGDLYAQHPAPQWTLESLRAAVQVGIDQLERGEVSTISMEDIIREENERYDQERATDAAR